MNKFQLYILQFKEMSLVKKVQLVFTGTVTVGLMTAIPVYAWFTSQKKAAEMFKVKYPNALYLNAAYREDQKYFELDGININDYAKDPVTGNTIKDQNDEPVFVSKYSYVFSVSGSSTNEFILQMAHTNNNKFTYTIYEATQCAGVIGQNGEYSITPEQQAKALAENDNDKIIQYFPHSGAHTENPIQVIGDVYVDDPPEELPPEVLYYVKGLALNGEYKNPKKGSNQANSDGDNVNGAGDNSTGDANGAGDNSAGDGNGAGDNSTGDGNGAGDNSTGDGNGNEEAQGAEGDATANASKLAEKNVSDSYYYKTYGDNLNVQELCVPLYWQGNVNVRDITDTSKFFCKYFILEVTWDGDEQDEQVAKETDMVYFSVKRVS